MKPPNNPTSTPISAAAARNCGNGASTASLLLRGARPPYFGLKVRSVAAYSDIINQDSIRKYTASCSAGQKKTDTPTTGKVWRATIVRNGSVRQTADSSSRSCVNNGC